mgnify:CR=1 FL=1
MFDGADDVVIAGAAAVVALDAVADLVIRRIGIALQQLPRGQDHAGRAETALEPVLLVKAVLDGVELAVWRQTFDSGYLGAVGLDRQQRARLHGATVEDHRAGAAATGVAAHVGPGQGQDFAQILDEQQPRFHFVFVLLSVYGYANGYRHTCLLCQSGSPEITAPCTGRVRVPVPGRTGW